MAIPGPSASGPAPRRLSRRRFLRLSGGLGGAAALALVLDACGSAASPTATTAPPTAAPSPTTAPAAAATSTAAPPTATTAPSPTTAPTSAPTAPPPPTAAAAPPTATAKPAPVEIQIYDFGFKPPTVTVPVGTTVKWVNTGVQHTTTSTDNLWDSGILDTGASFTYTFTKAGNYPYQCTLHPDMKATIVVQ